MPAGWRSTSLVGAQPSERMIIGSLRISRTSHAGRLPTGLLFLTVIKGETDHIPINLTQYATLISQEYPSYLDK